ncbi:MAG: tetraacyldisaccharide 4'-kinase [Planctomycetota bacterium]|nr:tetraacyldisaccharide 4'-kinase [Planctomycetota bacterium]
MGRSSSLLPPALRWAGPFLAAGYGLGTRIDRALSTPRPAPLPTICIGNITVGGTGKTPAVKHFARELAARGRKPAVLLRGYKGQGSDEAAELRTALADLKIPILIGADRLASARLAWEQGCDVALLDDGFQHWRLARDLDIVLVDATDPFGGGHLAPWGRLREGPAALARAGAVIISRADAVPADELSAVEKAVARHAPQAALARARHKPVGLRDCLDDKARLSLEKLKGTPLLAACGLGNPVGFLETLRQLGANLRDTMCFPDHHQYGARELDSCLIPAARNAGAQAIVVTEKDAAKLRPVLAGVSFPIWVLTVAFVILEGQDAVWARVGAALQAGDKRRSG